MMQSTRESGPILIVLVIDYDFFVKSRGRRNGRRIGEGNNLDELQAPALISTSLQLEKGKNI
jgi:hypothetical protein